MPIQLRFPGVVITANVWGYAMSKYDAKPFLLLAIGENFLSDQFRISHMASPTLVINRVLACPQWGGWAGGEGKVRVG